MLDYLYRAGWDQAHAYLASGNPPIYVRLMAINALFLGIYAVRRAVGSPPMTLGMGFFVQLVIVGANLLVLYQQEVTDYLLALTNRS
jgi:hypothetical protein